MQRGPAGWPAFILRADAVRRAQSVHIGRNIGVADRGRADQVLGAVIRSAVGVDNDRARPRKILQQPRTHRLHHRPHRLAVVIGGHGDQNVHLANVDQLADKIIRKYACFQAKLLAAIHSSAGTNKTDTVPWSANTADPRYAEKCFCRTSPSEYFRGTLSDRVPRLAPRWKDCSPREWPHSPTCARRAPPVDSRDTKTRSTRAQTPRTTFLLESFP